MGTQVVYEERESTELQADDKRYRKVARRNGREQMRPVVATRQECLDGEGDFHDPKLGWLRSGGKRETDIFPADSPPRDYEPVPGLHYN